MTLSIIQLPEVHPLDVEESPLDVKANAISSCDVNVDAILPFDSEADKEKKVIINYMSLTMT